MSLISIVSFAILFMLFLSFLRKGRDLFAPGRLFLIVWLSAIGLTELKLSWFQYEWSVYSWIVLLVCLLSTLLGIYVVYVLNFGKENSTVKQQRIIFDNSNINSRKLFVLIIIMFSLYLFSYAVIYQVVGYVPLFTPRPDLTRSKWGIFGLGLIIHIVPPIIYFVVIYTLITKKNVLKKIVLFAVAAVSVISYIFLVQRFDLIMAVVVSAVYLFYASKKLNPRNTLILLVVAGLLLYGVSTLRTSNLYININYIFSKMKFSSAYAFITEPYMYVCMNLENLAHASEKISSYTYGFYTFDFVWAVSGLKHQIIEYANLNEFYGLITPSYNTFTLYYAFYRDFGLFGAFVLSSMLGVVFGKLYYNLKYRPILSNLSLYGMFVFVIIFSFFIPMISFLHFVFNVLVVFFVSKICTKE